MKAEALALLLNHVTELVSYQSQDVLDLGQVYVTGSLGRARAPQLDVGLFGVLDGVEVAVDHEVAVARHPQLPEGVEGAGDVGALLRKLALQKIGNMMHTTKRISGSEPPLCSNEVVLNDVIFLIGQKDANMCVVFLQVCSLNILYFECFQSDCVY